MRKEAFSKNNLLVSCLPFSNSPSSHDIALKLQNVMINTKNDTQI